MPNTVTTITTSASARIITSDTTATASGDAFTVTTDHLGALALRRVLRRAAEQYRAEDCPTLAEEADGFADLLAAVLSTRATTL